MGLRTMDNLRSQSRQQLLRAAPLEVFQVRLMNPPLINYSTNTLNLNIAATAVGSFPSSSSASTPSSSSSSGGNPLTTTDIIIIAVIAGIVVLIILGYLIYRCYLSANARHRNVHHPANQFGGSEYGQHVPYQPTYGAPTAYASAPTVVGPRSVLGGGAPTVIGRGPTAAGIVGWSAGVQPGAPPPPSEMASNYGDNMSRY